MCGVMNTYRRVRLSNPEKVRLAGIISDGKALPGLSKVAGGIYAAGWGRSWFLGGSAEEMFEGSD